MIRKKQIKLENNLIQIIKDEKIKLSPDQESFIKKAYRSFENFLSRIEADIFWEKVSQEQLQIRIELIQHSIIKIDAMMLLDYKSHNRKALFTKKYFDFFDNHLYGLYKSFWTLRLSMSSLYIEIVTTDRDSIIPSLLFACYKRIKSDQLFDQIFKYHMYELFWDKYCDYLENLHLKTKLERTIHDFNSMIHPEKLKTMYNVLDKIESSEKNAKPVLEEWEGPLYYLGKIAYEKAMDENWSVLMGWNWAINKFTFKGEKITVKRLSKSFYKKYPSSI